LIPWRQRWLDVRADLSTPRARRGRRWLLGAVVVLMVANLSFIFWMRHTEAAMGIVPAPFGAYVVLRTVLYVLGFPVVLVALVFLIALGMRFFFPAFSKRRFVRREPPRQPGAGAE